MSSSASATPARRRTPARGEGHLQQALEALHRGEFGVRLSPGGAVTPGIAAAFNALASRNQRLCDELAKVASAVGKKGDLTARAALDDASGGWATSVEAVNGMVGDLMQPTTEMARVIDAVAQGDLTVSVPLVVDRRPVRGEFLRTARTVNRMVKQLGTFASEVTRVAREVGTEGKLGGQARVKGVAGTWKDLTDHVNSMADNLTSQVRNIAEVTTAVARGDLSKHITVDVKGEILELKETINTMVDRLGTFASEVTRVAREVGTEGKLGGQAQVRGVAGVWKDLTDNVNSMADNLTSQVRNIAEVTTAVAGGDLSRQITVDVKGEILELKNTINVMVDRLGTFASEVTRVAREVGTEGKLGGQARVKGVAGTWKDLTDHVNSMAANLTSQVRNIAEVTTAVARGDLSKKITVDVKGEIRDLKETINTMVDQLKGFGSEVTRVAREVGTEGKLGGQAKVEGVAGTWKDLTDNVNSMAANLTSQVRNIAEVTTAVARGDLSKQITVQVRGEIRELKDTINTMVDQLNAFAGEVSRVAKEVGTDGKLGGQAQVRGVAGVWKDLTDNVNSMAANLTSQVRNIAEVTTAVARGDLSTKVTVEVKGEIFELKKTINTMVDQLNAFAGEVTRVAKEVGTDGKLGGQAQVRGVAGVWKDLTDNVNSMADNLTSQVRNIAEVTTAVAGGDLSRKITVLVKGEIRDLKDTINTMVDQLNAFASEVTRVAREVGTEGKLGGQATVRGVAGVWKDLTDNVNTMAENLTSQVRGIARVVTSVANGDLDRKLSLEAKGEIAILADTINAMIDTLATFADQVSGVAREVGVQGRLGGQAQVPSAAGTWRDLTDNVNQLAANLTTQVRAIAEVATAVTEGDLTRSVSVDARGEVAALKDNINEMIRNLKETTHKNTQQDWLNSNLARFGRMLQGQRDLQTVARMILSEVASLVNAQHGVFYMLDRDERRLTMRASYAHVERADTPESFAIGEGLVGQCALERERILLGDVPGSYVRLSSGLGEAAPFNLAVLPVLFESKVKAVIELASFQRFNETHLAFLEQLCETIGIVLNTIDATMQTEDLLRQSQLLTERLKAQQGELKRTNEELEEKAGLLGEQKAEVEKKNRAVEEASRALEEKAEQLSLASRYKSEFLANMSHELRTPLNSLLILAKLLADDSDGNLTPKQIEFAETIHSCGRDLLALINEILDLSKIESGTMVVDISDMSVVGIAEYAERSFRQVADNKGLRYTVRVEPDAPVRISTDPKRLQQVLRNLLSNAFKFTERGEVRLTLRGARSGWSPDHPILSAAENVVAFEVTDTGIGISPDKHRIVFEAFQQADGTTSRKFGGTGLGLSISREISRLLGGEIRLQSSPGRGSTFTLYLPLEHSGSTAGGMRSVGAVTRSASAPRIGPAPTLGAVRAAAAAADDALDAASPYAISDDRDNGASDGPTILIVEDDDIFAGLLLTVVRELGYKGVICQRGELAQGLARRYKPVAVLLDVGLPGMDGWSVLDRMKHDPEVRHIPVIVLSGAEAPAGARLLGVYDYMRKPVERQTLLQRLEDLRSFLGRPSRHLLIVEGDAVERERLATLLGGTRVSVTAAAKASEALQALGQHEFECVVLGSYDDEGGAPLLERLRADKRWSAIPVIAYGAAPTAGGEWEAQRVIPKGARAAQQLLAETSLFLHRPASELSEAQHLALRGSRAPDQGLAGCRVLVVDDDVRNVFAISSMLERQGIVVIVATNGREAIDRLKAEAGVDAVLMDVMMPEMDGYQTMREIRKMPQFMSLPIVALTAKAMQGDREKCIEAGASDYLAKPVEAEQLYSLLRVWTRAEGARITSDGVRAG